MSVSASIGPERAPRPAHLALATGYTIVSFPVGGLVLQGVEVNGVVLPRPWLELTLGTAALGPVSAAGGGVDAVMSIIPVSAAALVRVAKQRMELLFGPSAELAFAVRLIEEHSTSALPVLPSTHDVIVGLGGEAEARLRAWETTWIFARVSALGVLLGERYDVSGTPSSTRRSSSSRRSPESGWRCDEPIFFPNLPAATLHYK